jgi:putative tricarboxylic transport membrane protein
LNFGDIIGVFSAQPELFLYILIGVFFGGVLGAIPGLGPLTGIILIMPFTFSMSSEAALVLVSSIYVGGVFGGATTAILFNIPGTPDSAISALEGYPLTKKGKAPLALGAAITSSAVGGTLGAIAIITLSNHLAGIGLLFGPYEYFSLVLMGIIITAAIGAKSAAKGYISALFGMFFATVGLSKVSTMERFTFDVRNLQAGIDMVPALIGIFVMAEVISYFMKPKNNTIKEHVDGKAGFAVMEVIKGKWIVLRSTVTGVLIGILPGAGATMATFLSYTVQSKIDKKNKYGTGEGQIKGVIAAEAANNSAAMGTLIPLFALGIPGGATAAVMYGIFEIHGLQPGPRLFMEYADSIYPVFTAILIANLLILPLGIVLSRMTSKLLQIPNDFLYTFMFCLAIIGAFSTSNNVWGILVMVMFGLVGLFMRRHGYSLVGMALGFILGPLLETNLMRMTISNHSLFERPIAILFLLVSAGFIANQLIRKIIAAKQNKQDISA